MKHPLQAPFTDTLPLPLFLRTMLMPDERSFLGTGIPGGIRVRVQRCGAGRGGTGQIFGPAAIR